MSYRQNKHTIQSGSRYSCYFCFVKALPLISVLSTEIFYIERLFVFSSYRAKQEEFERGLNGEKPGQDSDNEKPDFDPFKPLDINALRKRVIDDFLKLHDSHNLIYDRGNIHFKYAACGVAVSSFAVNKNENNESH